MGNVAKLMAERQKTNRLRAIWSRNSASFASAAENSRVSRLKAALLAIKSVCPYMKRSFDFFLAVFVGLALLMPISILAILVRLTSPGPAFYWSDRVGRNNKIFRMPKFRSMRIDTPLVATHLLENPQGYLTPIGGFLRRSSLDELPQLWCILKGDMSFVGPRPALFNQYDLIEFRTRYGIHILLPGLTGWAQVNGRDELAISEKVTFDLEYLQCQSFAFDFRVLWLTFLKVVKRDGVSH